MKADNLINHTALNRNESENNPTRIGLHPHRPVLLSIPNLTPRDRSAKRIASWMPAQPIDEIEKTIPLNALVNVIVAGQDGGSPPFGKWPLQGWGGAVEARGVRRMMQHDEAPGSISGLEPFLQPARLARIHRDPIRLMGIAV